MKTEIIRSEKITKEMAIKELNFADHLTQEEVNEYLDIISAINSGGTVFCLTTNIGEYLLYIKGESITDTKKKYKKLNEDNNDI
jgi:hypothetical protein